VSTVEQIEGDLRFGLVGGVAGDTAFFPAWAVILREPFLSEEEAAVKESMSIWCGVGEEDARLAVVDFPEAAAILAIDADGFLAFFWEVGAVDAINAERVGEGESGLLFMAESEAVVIPGHGADEFLEACDASLAEGLEGDGFDGFSGERAQEALEVGRAQRLLLDTAPAIAEEGMEGGKVIDEGFEVLPVEGEGRDCFFVEKSGHGFSSFGYGRKEEPVSERGKVRAMDAELGSEGWVQGIEEYLLGVAMKAERPSIFGESLSGAEGDPVGGLVASAGEAIFIDEGFERREGMTHAIGPILGNTPGGLGEDVGGQMGDTDPGEDEEAAVVGDLMEVATTGVE
jgi:hypothetical protein